MAIEADGITAHTCKRGSGNGQNQSQSKSSKPLAATATDKIEVPRSKLETLELVAAIRELAAAIRQSKNGSTNGTKAA